MEEKQQQALGEVILGVDPGTRSTGYGLIHHISSRLEVVDFGVIRAPKDSCCYHAIFRNLVTLMATFRPTAMAVETQFLCKNVQSTIKLGMARGAALIAAAEQQVPVFGYAPREAKRAVSGSGGASKLHVQQMVQMLLQLPALPQPEDAADALALAVCHLHRHRWQERRGG